MTRAMGFVRGNSLGLFFGLLFVVSVVAHAFADLADFNNQQLADGLAPVGLGQYVTSADFAVDVTENWQSEYLQFLLYILLTVWLVQRGSPESKPPGMQGMETDEQQKVGQHADTDSPRWARAGGWRTGLYSWSLVTTSGTQSCN